MEILKIKDSQGNWIEVPAIIGPKGDQGEPGLQGATGDKGADGFSPIAKVETIPNGARSEERRVGKECRSRWSPYH